MRTRHALAATTVLCAAAATVLAGCGGGDSGGGSFGNADGATVPKPAAGQQGLPDQGAGSRVAETGGSGSAGGTAGGSGTAGGTALVSGTSARVLPPGRDVVYRGETTVRVQDVGVAVTRVQGLVGAADGVVFAEQTTTDPRRLSASSASMTLRVPPTQFRPLLDRLGRLGKPLSRSQTAEDVTTQVVDLESRLSSQRRSVARVRALLDEARTIGQIVQVEGELARREADLESLEAQQKKLRDITDLATIELSLVTPGVESPAPAEDKIGFLAGLRGGLGALVALLAVVLTVVGAVLPFVITLALVGVPAWVVLRRRRSTSVGAGPSAPVLSSETPG